MREDNEPKENLLRTIMEDSEVGWEGDGDSESMWRKNLNKPSLLLVKGMRILSITTRLIQILCLKGLPRSPRAGDIGRMLQGMLYPDVTESISFKGYHSAGHPTFK